MSQEHELQLEEVEVEEEKCSRLQQLREELTKLGADDLIKKCDDILAKINIRKRRQ